MRTLLLGLFALLISSLPGQALTPTEIVEIKLGKPFQLRRGAGYEFLGLYPKGDLKIHFLHVITDSRCPVNASCFWAGDAALEFSIKQGLVAKKIMLNTFSKTQSSNIFGYRLELRNLKPEKGARPTGHETAELRLIKP
jgi:hypothetical protein